MKIAGPHVKRTELRALTGLRAVAALAVVVSHTSVPKSAPSWLERLVGWGHIGVPLFFMLSGVVLAYNYPELTFRQKRRTVAFYVARVARVMPLYWVMVLYCVLFYASIRHEQYPSALLQNVFAVQTWSPNVLDAQSRYNGPGWSIGVELFFYLLFPFVAPLVARVARRAGLRGLLTIVLGGALVSLGLWALFLLNGWSALPASDPASAHRWLYRNPLPHLVEFVVGMSVAYALPMLREWPARTQSLVQTGVLVYVIGLATLRPDSSAAFSSGSFGAFFVLPFALAMASLASGKGWLARLLATNPLVALGTASYALYLTHRWFVWQLSTGEVITTGKGWAPWLGLLVTIAVLLAIAEGAHRYVEVPARIWILARTNRWLQRRPSAHGEPVPPGDQKNIVDRTPGPTNMPSDERTASPAISR